MTLRRNNNLLILLVVIGSNLWQATHAFSSLRFTPAANSHQWRLFVSSIDQTKPSSKPSSNEVEVSSNGYAESDGYSRALSQKEGILSRITRSFRKIEPGMASSTEYLMNSRGRIRRKPGNLILMRLGESEGEGDYIGWSDPDMSDKGTQEVEHSARLLREAGYDIDLVFTSRLKRAVKSTWVLLKELDESYLPVFKSWRLNARSYGKLTGLSRDEVQDTLGKDVRQWRADPHFLPPPLSMNDPRWPGQERKYADLALDNIPLTESLADCMDRVKPLWEERIQKELLVGHTVLVVGHRSSLLGLLKHAQGISDEEAAKFHLPPGSPLVVEFDDDLQPVTPLTGKNGDQDGLKGSFLEKPGLLAKALETQLSKSAVDYDSAMSSMQRSMSSLETCLVKLQAERELEVMCLNSTGEIDEISTFDSFDSGFEEEEDTLVSRSDLKPIISRHPCLGDLPEGMQLPDDIELPSRKASTIVMVRHGKTEHNKLGLFTGWEDPPLAKEGVEEAIEAGKLLKRNGFEFDVVYSSWLSRALTTAWEILDQLDSTWLPIVKSWRLNERMYGDLTGKSKKMVARMCGEEQFYMWRRGYEVRPPKVDSFSPYYPGNEKRYVRYMTDVPYSLSESVIRSIGQRKITLSRRFPKTESLKDCMERTIPYLVDHIQPEAVDQGKRVLIASSENAIRGMLMHLCDIPEDLIAKLNIPNGVPIIYDVNSKRVKLLDDGSGIDPLEKYDFGAAAKYLFRPMEEEVEVGAEECDFDELGDELVEKLNELARQAAVPAP